MHIELFFIVIPTNHACMHACNSELVEHASCMLQVGLHLDFLHVLQPRKPGSFTCARAPAKTLVPSGHVNPQILGVIRIAASLPLREEW
jgi:hypothetical protein